MMAAQEAEGPMTADMEEMEELEFDPNCEYLEEQMFTKSSGNPFEDFGMVDSDILLAKARLAQKITAVMREHDLTQEEVGRQLRVDQPTVSRITRGQLSNYSIGKLMDLVRRLNVDVVITVVDNQEPRPAHLIVRDPQDDPLGPRQGPGKDETPNKDPRREGVPVAMVRSVGGC